VAPTAARTSRSAVTRDGCERFAATLAAWEAEWAWADEG
jgi:hypothetical protein